MNTKEQLEVAGWRKRYDEFLESGYSISPSGEVASSSGKVLKHQIYPTGYPFAAVVLAGRAATVSIHRMIACAYIPNPENKPQVNHIDGNKANYAIENLEWCTQSENMKHGIRIGIIPKSMVGRTGSKHFRAKAVQQIKDGVVIAEFGSTREAERSGWDATSVQDACKGRLKTYKGYVWQYTN